MIEPDGTRVPADADAGRGGEGAGDADGRETTDERRA